MVRKSDLWQFPLVVLLFPLWVPLFLLGLAIVGGAELFSRSRGHETDPTLVCGCTRCLYQRRHAG